VAGSARRIGAGIWPDRPGLLSFSLRRYRSRLLFWTQIGLQHGAEMAARCASVNSTLCPNSDPNAITSYATQQTFGLNLPSSTFSYSTPTCGNQVSASYTFQFPEIFNVAPLTLTAKACFPS
jgi:hypothetical protein